MDEHFTPEISEDIKTQAEALEADLHLVMDEDVLTEKLDDLVHDAADQLAFARLNNDEDADEDATLGLHSEMASTIINDGNASQLAFLLDQGFQPDYIRQELGIASPAP